MIPREDRYDPVLNVIFLDLQFFGHELYWVLLRQVEAVKIFLDI